MKILLLIILYICFIAPSFAFVPERITPVDIRSEGMGGTQYADSESFYTLFSNPAGISFTGDKTLLPTPLPFSFGGPFNSLDAILDSGIISDFESITGDEINTLLGELLTDTGINVDAKIGLPLTFGAIRNNFGWGFTSSAYVYSHIPSLHKSHINIGGDLGFVFGYAKPFDFEEFGMLSVGISGRVTSQINVIYDDAMTAILDTDFSTLPAYTSFGVGFDLGVQYKAFDMLHVAVVWQDLFSPVWTQTSPGFSALFDGEEFVYDIHSSKLGFGFALDIPVEKKVPDIISHLGIYLNYDDILETIFAINAGEVAQNPLLNFKFGTEIVLFDIFAFRIGLHETYPAMGFSVRFGKTEFDYSIYGEENGLEPGAAPETNMGFSFTVNY